MRLAGTNFMRCAVDRAVEVAGEFRDRARSKRVDVNKMATEVEHEM